MIDEQLNEGINDDSRDVNKAGGFTQPRRLLYPRWGSNGEGGTGRQHCKSLE